MAWDRERYLAEVLEPARKAGNVPPPDLYVRYGLPAGLSDQAAFARQVTEVVAFWRELKGRRMYARLADALITAHAKLEQAGRLTLRSFAERHADARREQLDRLARLAEAEAGAATHVGPATVARLRDALGGAVSDAEVARALERAGVRVVASTPRCPPRRTRSRPTWPGTWRSWASGCRPRSSSVTPGRASGCLAGSGWPTGGR